MQSEFHGLTYVTVQALALLIKATVNVTEYTVAACPSCGRLGAVAAHHRG